MKKGFGNLQTIRCRVQTPAFCGAVGHFLQPAACLRLNVTL